MFKENDQYFKISQDASSVKNDKEDGRQPDKLYDAEKKHQDFSTFSAKGELLQPHEINEIAEHFKSGVILSHAINKESKNLGNIFKQILSSNQLESEASLIGTKKERAAVEIGPSQTGYVLPDISFLMNGIFDDLNFLIPLEDALKNHDFYGEQVRNTNGRADEFHIYPNDSLSIKKYNQYRDTRDKSKLEGFENKCPINNAVLLFLRTQRNKHAVDWLIKIVTESQESKIKGFCVIDIGENIDDRAIWKKIQQNEHFHISDLLRGWADSVGIKLYNGQIENHPALKGIEKKKFEFTDIHGLNAYDRQRNEVFSISDKKTGN